MHPVIEEITQKIRVRSQKKRDQYLKQVEEAQSNRPHRSVLACGNLAHGFAACAAQDKAMLRGMTKPNIAIISAYNDMLSAHQPYEHYPRLLKESIHQAGGVAQFAGGVPAMCDGITQGQPGMELSLMSRDIIAMSAAIALSHNMFDGALMLGICDKIVPGLLIAALRFGHLPFVFVPAGPMLSGIPNPEKVRIRQLYAQGKVGKDALLDVEASSYHAPGTCTFYGTANSNQLIVEVMGLHLPGASFIHPQTPMREALTKAAGKTIIGLTHLGDNYCPIAKIIDFKSIVNGMIALLATGGSTNHTMHLVAVARAAGIVINWDDLSTLSTVVPLVARIYPNGEADINAFHEAGGTAFLMRTLLEQGLLYEEVYTVAGYGLHHYMNKPVFNDDQLVWVDGPTESSDLSVLTPAVSPFKAQGGLSLLSGNLGRAVIKTSSLPPHVDVVEAEAVVFSSQQELEDAFNTNQLNKDCVVVVRFQGPKACGMPELHKLTPLLGVLQERGYRVALVTDGRMSGASGKIPAAIHLTPEACDGGFIAKVQTGDVIRLDIPNARLNVLLSEDELAKRAPEAPSCDPSHYGMGRELFHAYRLQLTNAEQGASGLFFAEDSH